MNISLTYAGELYDRTTALALGDVRPSGIDLTYLRMPVEEAFWRMARTHDFDASEMSFSSYILHRAQGDTSLTAIPVFTSRFFRHGYLFVNADSGIRGPEDLKGKRMGVPEYQITAVVWIRGLLEDEYGIKPSDLQWFQGGQEQPGRIEKLPISVPGVQITPIPEDRTISQMLASGEIDVMMTARAPSTFDGVRVKRLFPNFRQVEQDYYTRTGIFPIMHTVVVRSDVLEQHPWVARNLFDAFVAAKNKAYRELNGNIAALPYMLPWLVEYLEDTRQVMGNDFWPYGVEPNRKTIETLIRYSVSQGLSPRPVAVEDLFAKATQEEYKI
jgi:4,5-dihydroxyphthalate decarboxylase